MRALFRNSSMRHAIRVTDGFGNFNALRPDFDNQICSAQLSLEDVSRRKDLTSTCRLPVDVNFQNLVATITFGVEGFWCHHYASFGGGIFPGVPISPIES